MSDINVRPSVGSAEVTEEAANWIERRTRPSWNADDEAALQAWIAGSTARRIAFWRLEAAWSETARLAALRQPTPLQLQRASATKVRSGISKSLAAIVVAATGYIALNYFTPQNQTYLTGLGERKILALSDGSQIELNTNTILRTAITGNIRKVWLDKGEAYFNVKHDVSHPFEVIAAGRRILDLGTQFNVRADGERLRVVVLQGRVSFDGRNGGVQTELKPGDVVVAQAGNISLTHIPGKELADRLSWRSGKLTFHHTPLFEVAAEFNRYNGKEIVVAGDSARDLTINGTFATNDVQAFARIAQTILGLKVDDKGSRILISH